MKKFNPEVTSSSENGLFGLPFNYEDSQLVILNCPWEVTTSYGHGASLGPEAILEASPQVDLFSTEFSKNYEKGFFLKEPNKQIKQLNRRFKSLAQEVIIDLEDHGQLSDTSIAIQNEINQASLEVNQLIYDEAQKALDDNKLVGLLGGDHSTPLGLIKALCEKYKGSIGVLHIDAHHDLRVQYQGFDHSHASIMHNVLSLKTPPSHLVQVGIRDFCESEFISAKSDKRVTTFYDQDFNEKQFRGASWAKCCDEIIQQLPTNIYISFDIDGLSPNFCPNTGTPVPGGLTYSQAMFLIKQLKANNINIIGFDLCEVAPSEDDTNQWDANVGARVLFQLCNWMMETQK